ncbi:MAG: hypothetical protein GEU98_24755 [Pseudonocardiaceae bacterium]|nr:hypothetical protein [Pseudonocardiaceae bacterium]
MTPTARLLSVVGIAAGLVLAGCGGANPQDTAAQRENNSPNANPNPLPEPRDPGIQLTMDEFPITVRPMGVETSPTLGEEPADPGDTQLGLMVEYRGTTKDRPTPAPGSFDLDQWTLVYPAPHGAECGTTREDVPDGPCLEDLRESALFDEHTANRQGMRLFEPKAYIEEHVDGDMTDENMKPGTGYVVELVATVPESLKPAEAQLCAVNTSEAEVADEAPKNCFELANLPTLPRRG